MFLSRKAGNCTPHENAYLTARVVLTILFK
jgi:hypothetical protein